jgi:apolipoprotein N-acyltransferase
MERIKSLRLLACAAVAGALAVAGFAPLQMFPLPLLSLAVLFALWRRAADAGQAAALGYAWGLGFFLAGVSWVYVSLHDVGGMAAPVAAAATLLFCAYLALFPALVGASYRHLRSERSWIDALLIAALWTGAELVRGGLFTGFPWLALGYSQTPPSPLAGYAPLLGSYGVGFVATLATAAALFAGRRPIAWLLPLALLVGGAALRPLVWSEAAGAPIRVSLLQGNIPQSLKWDPRRLDLSIRTYLQLAREHPAQLTVLPETAIPLFFEQIPPEMLAALRGDGELLLGAVMRLGDDGYANGAVTVDRDGRTQRYLKRHLVPFGEFVPPGFAWFFGLVNIPLTDFSRGAQQQPPLPVAGQQLMPNICYEDLFGEELIATLLVNLSNTAWFGDSLAQPQHLQIARMRALETARPMLRATNTGMTAAIGPDGQLIAVLPAFTRDALSVEVRGYRGITPYVHYGNAGVLLLALLALLPALAKRWWRPR